jgi:predicted transport protein
MLLCQALKLHCLYLPANPIKYYFMPVTVNTVLYRQGFRYNEINFKTEAEFEKLVVEHSKMLFGQQSIYIDAKKKINNSAFGGVIPDGFLFDLTDKNTPEFYIVEVELSKHSFFNHIFPQITKFFAFFKNPESQSKLIEKLYEIFAKDDSLLQQLKSRINKDEIFKFLKDTIENSQNILLVIDNEKREFPEIIETYTDTWGKMVKVAILKQYNSINGPADEILTLSPDFANIETIDIVVPSDEKGQKQTAYTESFHLDGIPDSTLSIYNKLKTELLRHIPNLTFNPQRYYISLRKKRNFAYLKIRRKKIAVIALTPEEAIRKAVPNYHIESLSEPVQRFYNNPCARIDVTNDSYLNQVINLLISIQK